MNYIKTEMPECLYNEAADWEQNKIDEAYDKATKALDDIFIGLDARTAHAFLLAYSDKLMDILDIKKEVK